MEYRNFNLRIESKVSDGYPVVVESEMGETEGRLILSDDCLKIVEQLKDVSGLGVISPLPLSLGVTLYDCLFQKRVARLLNECLGAVKDDEQGLRIRLKLAPAEIAALPWEVLYDEGAKCFLATSDKTPLTRYIELEEPIKALKIEPPVKVLTLIPGQSGLDVEKEEQIIAQALANLPEVQMRVLKDKVTQSDISRALVEEQYHILHFIGHGTFENGDGKLVLNSEGDGYDLISASDFADFFRDYPSLKLVVLNACQGAEVSSSRQLAGVAPQLVARGIPAVVAMQYPISDVAALTFAKEFYLKLCKGWNRGQVDSAISHARNRMNMSVKEPLAFATPVLFLRSPTGVIFDLESNQTGLAARLSRLFSGSSVKQVNRLKEVKKTYEKNIEAWQAKANDADAGTREEAAEAIAREQEEVSAVDRRIVEWKRALVASVLAMLIVLFLSFIGLFEVAGADSWLDRRLIPYMDNFIANKINQDVKLIMSDEGVNGDLGEAGPGWRKYHVPLINALAGKARVIVFDLEMSLTTDQDKALADAIRHAEESGTHVVLAKVVNQDGATTKDLAAELSNAIDDRWGNIRTAGLNWGFVRSYQLAQSARQSADTPLTNINVPSLALQAVAQFTSPKSKPKIVVDEDKNQIEIIGDATRSIPVYEATSSVYDLGYRLIDYEDLKGATRSYRDVYQRLSDDAFLREFQGKIVFIGFRQITDQFRVDEHEQRYGTEIHANIASNILTGDYISWVSTPVYLLIVAAMVGIGALVRARFAHVFSITVTLPFTEGKRRFDIPGLLFVVDVVYLLAGFLLFKGEHIYIVRTYHLIAPFIAYWLTGKMRRRSAPGSARGLSS